MFDDLVALDLGFNNKPSGLGYKYNKASIFVKLFQYLYLSYYYYIGYTNMSSMKLQTHRVECVYF